MSFICELVESSSSIQQQVYIEPWLIKEAVYFWRHALFWCVSLIPIYGAYLLQFLQATSSFIFFTAIE